MKCKYGIICKIISTVLDHCHVVDGNENSFVEIDDGDQLHERIEKLWCER